jgi:RHS repeat-associated protein
MSEDGVDEWAHVMASRSSGTVKLSVNGVEVGSIADPGEVFDGGTDFIVGENLTGALDEMRLSSVDCVAEDTVGKVVVDYAYNARNQLVTETSGASVKTYSYDKNGNALLIVEDVMGIEIAREEMTYDELNRMLSHTGPNGTETFTYRGAEWHRFSQNGGADGKTFLYDGDNVLADIAGGVTDAFYVTPFLDQNLSITRDPDGTSATHYYSHDGLGSVRTLTDSDGVVANTYDYLPFGGAYQPGTNVTVEQRYTYAGRERNPSSALMYYRYRQYNPRVGRFERRDPAGYASNVDGNIYSYNAGAVTTYVDPMGLGGVNPATGEEAPPGVDFPEDEGDFVPPRDKEFHNYAPPGSFDRRDQERERERLERPERDRLAREAAWRRRQEERMRAGPSSWGWAGYLFIGGVGAGKVTCCDENNCRISQWWKKICGGPGLGATVQRHSLHEEKGHEGGVSGKNCPSGYSGVFYEVELQLAVVHGSVADTQLAPGPSDPDRIIGTGGGVGLTGVGGSVAVCYYWLVGAPEVIGKCSSNGN